ncbi:hypothetical protein BKA57DRAFT_509471 [Linnemannia elongata]|nr:hypothetical protein BKA57DRAFT_509471 [Linnemannia elongata]
MSSTFPLPQELLETIIRTLGRLHGNGSVATMLRVNKYVCSITLPILYGGVPVSVLNQYYPKDSPAFKRRQKLITTLLLSVPKDRITDLLRATFLQDSVDDQENSPAPYAQYHSFAVAISLSNCNDAFDGSFLQIDGFREDYFRFHQDNGPPSQKLLDFVKDHGLKDRYAIEAPLAGLLLEGRFITFTNTINRELRRDLTWALCSDVERLRYLDIPVSDIGRYLPLVDQLKALLKVRFELDRRLFPTRVDLEELTPEQRTVLNHQRDERKQHLDQMVLFVQGLRHRHGSVLQAAACSGKYPLLSEECPDGYEEQLNRLFPPLPDPKALITHNWAHFATKVKETNLSAVKTIVPPDDQPEALSLPRLLEQSLFLHRCRSLESISLKSIADDVFQWAVDERRQCDADVAEGRPPQRPLVPLRHVEVNNERPTDGRLINDIGYSFGKTLKTLNFNSHRTSENEESVELEECSVGNSPSWSPCWHAPQLTNLIIHVDHTFLRIHPSLFTQCPQLKYVTLKDRRHEYSAGDIIRWKPAKLHQLENLRLHGSPALSFHPGILRSTPELKSLIMRMIDYDEPSYIPPVSELEEPGDELGDDPEELAPTAAETTLSSPSRPIWTWDWDLSKLTNLELTSEFAYRFQFKLLRSTPSLERFLVDTRSFSDQHKRTLGVKDLLQNTQDSTAMDYTQDDDNDDNTLDPLQLQYIHLPNLTDFSLIGDWTLDRRVLTILCRKVLPKNQRHLSLQGCSGFGFQDWVKTILQYLPKLAMATASCEVTSDMATEVGLVVKYDYREAGDIASYRLVDHPSDINIEFRFYSIGIIE